MNRRGVQVGFSKPATQRELDFIRANWKAKTKAEMASELGRSERFVYKKINDMHLREDAPEAPVQVRPEKGGREPRRVQGGAGGLEELRDLLWADLLDAKPREAPALAERYMEVLAEIEKRGGGEEADEGGGIADIVRLVRAS